MENNKILAVVKFNDSEAFVLQKEPELVFKKYGNDTIVGTDGVFFQFYGLEHGTTQAFAGRKFDITLDTGEVIHCTGQWWDKITDTAVKEFNINKEDNKIVYATAASIDSLKNCYVFYGYKTMISKWNDLRKLYTKKVYGYWEYEKVLKIEKQKKEVVDALEKAGYYNPWNVFHHYPEFMLSQDSKYSYEIHIVKWNTRSVRMTVLYARYCYKKEKWIFAKKPGVKRYSHGEKMR